MNATEELNAPHLRNDLNTIHAVMSHCRANYADVFGEVHYIAAVQSALTANDAKVGCDIADRIAETLAKVRARLNIGR